MKSILLYTLLITVNIVGYSQATNNHHAYGGVPSDGTYLERQGYIMQFDARNKTPRWVAYYVEPSYTETPPRSDWGKFRDDPDLNNEATEQDYKNQFNTWRNYAKGHLAPYYISGGDRDQDGLDAEDGDIDDAKTVHEIMYMSNMAPQHHYNFNGAGGLWYKLETYIRDTLLKDQRKAVWVVAGCIFGPGSYDSINGIEVPPMFYKIVVTESAGIPKILAFLFPHQIKKHGDIQDFLVSVDLIEAMTGLDFFPEKESSDWEIVERTSTVENWE